MSETIFTTDIVVQIIDVVADVLKKNPAEIMGTETYQELGVDTLDMFEIILKLEDTFMVEISDTECEQLISIPTTSVYIKSKISQTNSV